MTVLVPAHNEGASIVQLIEACRNQPYPLDEIVVVADSCTDETPLLAQAAGARVVTTDCKDKAGAQNAVLWSIESDVIVGFDGDTRPAIDCIEKMINDLNTKSLDATCSTILPWQAKGFLIRARRFSYAMGRRWWRLCQARVGRIQVLTGASYAFRTHVIRDVGGFPAGLISADMDATWAMHAAGYKLGYTADAVAYTMDPETFRVWRLQMRRWAAGYAQNMAKYRREILHPRALLVVGTALFDLVSLFVAYGVIAYAIVTGRGLLLVSLYGGTLAIRLLLNIVLVATVVGLREAILGFFPWLVMNFYTRWLYLSALGREWILGRHYTSWTGRQGRATVISPMTSRRKAILTLGLSALPAAVRSSGTPDARVGAQRASNAPMRSMPSRMSSSPSAYDSLT